MQPTSKQKRIIVNADDFGFSTGITDGIIQAHRDGIVTSTTVAANMPAAGEAIARLAEVPSLAVGVHLNVTQGSPLSEAGKALTGPDGLMNWTANKLVLATLVRPGLLKAIFAECEAQIQWVLAQGVTPTHIDSHRHVHAYWPIFLGVLKLARRYDIELLRRHHEVLPGRDWPESPAKQVRNRRVLNLLGAGCRVLAPGMLATDGTWGVAHTGLIDTQFLIQVARRARPGVIEIMTHPGFAEDIELSVTRLRESRRVELESLCDPRVRQAFDEEGIELIDYSALK